MELTASNHNFNPPKKYSDSHSRVGLIIIGSWLYEGIHTCGQPNALWQPY